MTATFVSLDAERDAWLVIEQFSIRSSPIPFTAATPSVQPCDDL